MPSFSDLRADDLLRAARAAGLPPRSDAELLPLLLDLVGGLIPVDAWPTQMSRQQRTAHARESAQADQAAADRPASAAPAAAAARQDNGNAGADAAVVPMRWRDQARDAATAVDAERRRRRERAAGVRPEPAPLMRDALRRGSMLRLPTRTRRTTGHGGQRQAGAAVTPAHRDDAGGPVPFVLPGPPPARETLAGWQQWRATRGTFTPAPRLDRAAWRAMPPRRRMLYDLHRAATHANLPLQQTPMSQAVTRVLRGGSSPTRSSTSRPPGPG